MTCKRCLEDMHPGNFDHPRMCAFESGTFDPENWHCLTLAALRYREDGWNNESHTEDQTARLYPWDGCFVVLGWYKSRGRVEFAGLLDEQTMRPLTLAIAEAVLDERPLFDFEDGELVR